MGGVLQGSCTLDATRLRAGFAQVENVVFDAVPLVATSAAYPISTTQPIRPTSRKDEHAMDWKQDVRKTGDDDLWAEAQRRALGFGVNDAELVDLALTELSLRSEEQTRDAIGQLKSSIDGFRVSSDRYSRRIWFLTWALVVLTALLAVPAAMGLVHFVAALLRSR
jgi:hypothetical protein